MHESAHRYQSVGMQLLLTQGSLVSNGLQQFNASLFFASFAYLAILSLPLHL